MLKSDKVDGGSKCRIWIAFRRDDSPPPIEDFVTGCNSRGAAQRWLEEYGLKGYAGYDYSKSEWFTPALTKDNFVL